MKKKNLRITGFLALFVLLSGAVIAYKIYNKPHRSVENETALAITSEELALAYTKNEAKADKEYLDKPIQVTGLIADIANNQQNKQVIVLQGTDLSGVQCTLDQNTPELKKGSSVAIKGFCTGYLTDVILDRCIVVSLK
jgi:tRNA_anti-like